MSLGDTVDTVVERKKRITHLDGLRGLAILWVLLFHAYARHSSIVPYGDQFADYFLLRMGWLGVELFFLISGFVIFMSLDKCRGVGQFIYKRWLRLFPAMLIATVLLFSTASFFPERPNGMPGLTSILPGLTFLPPSWWNTALGLKITPLEAAFWSLYVEFKFYVIASFIYFFIGRKFLVPALLLLNLSYYALYALVSLLGIEWTFIHFLREMSISLSLHHFGWFAAGAAFYLAWDEENNFWFWVGVGIACLSCLAVGRADIQVTAAACLVSMVFAASFKFQTMRSFLSLRLLLFFGFVSYPLYLIHENFMVASIVKLHELLPAIPDFLYPLPPILTLCLVSFFISYRFEGYIRRGIDVIPKSSL